MRAAEAVLAAALVVAAATGCADDSPARACLGSERPAAPLAGGEVVVPARDATPPAARLTLSATADSGRSFRCRAGSRRFPRAMRVRLAVPRVRATATGVDEDGGIARIRISIDERVTCRAGDRPRRRIRLRYLPPPAIARIRVPAGAVQPVRRSRSATLRLGSGVCPGGAGPAAVHGRIWADATNAHERESSALARFRWRG
jgi:hypothetical protein